MLYIRPTRLRVVVLADVRREHIGVFPSSFTELGKGTELPECAELLAELDLGKEGCLMTGEDSGGSRTTGIDHLGGLLLRFDDLS